MGVSKLHGKVARAAVSVALSGAMAFGGLMAAPMTAFAASGAPALAIEGLDETASNGGVVGYKIFTLDGVDASDVDATTAASVTWAVDATARDAIIAWLNGEDNHASKKYDAWLLDQGYMSNDDTAEVKATKHNTASFALAYIKAMIDDSTGSVESGENGRFIPAKDTFAFGLSRAIHESGATAVIKPATSDAANFDVDTAEGYWVFMPVTLKDAEAEPLEIATLDDSAIPVFTVRTNGITSASIKNIYASLVKTVKGGGDTGEGLHFIDATKGDELTYTLAANFSKRASGDAVITDTVDNGITINLDTVSISIDRAFSFTKTVRKDHEVTSEEIAEGGAYYNDGNPQYQAGQTIKVDAEETVTKAAGALTKGEDYTVESANGKMTITIKDYAVQAANYTITYKGTLNESAKKGLGTAEGQGFNKNSAVLSYSGQDTVASEAKVATYQLELDKYDKDTNAAVEGAEFSIKKGDQYVQADGSLGATESTFTTASDGTIVAPFIDAGTYTITETTPAPGYEGLTRSFEVVVGSAFNENGDAVENYGVTIKHLAGANVTTQADVDLDAGLITIKVPNTKTIYLPITGMTPSQLGTIMGAALVAAGAITIAMRRRNAEQA